MLFRVGLGFLSFTLFIVAFFLVAGRWDWVAGWAYLGLLTLGQGACALFLWRKDPELIRRRGTLGEGTRPWDKALLGLFGLSYLGVPIVGALDASRNGWSSMPGGFWALGLGMYAFFTLFTTWAMAVNTHFEKTVRIQTDRDHRVIDTGPYRIVRHPGYVGTILGFLLSPPFLLLSWWAFAPAAAASLVLVLRTALEDRFLQNELQGYAEYAKRVRYRLVPGVW